MLDALIIPENRSQLIGEKLHDDSTPYFSPKKVKPRSKERFLQSSSSEDESDVDVDVESVPARVDLDPDRPKRQVRPSWRVESAEYEVKTPESVEVEDENRDLERCCKKFHIGIKFEERQLANRALLSGSLRLDES